MESFLDDAEEQANECGSSSVSAPKKSKTNGDEKIVQTLTLEEEAETKIKQVNFPQLGRYFFNL